MIHTHTCICLVKKRCSVNKCDNLVCHNEFVVSGGQYLLCLYLKLGWLVIGVAVYELHGTIFTTLCCILVLLVFY